ncbi:MAG: glycosyltransferase family 2 protein [Muribaculaceae bacterium]
MPKISVIVPVYNAEQWLERCIDSIVAQTYTDWELLLVDDGSADRSGDICDRYAAADPRIRAFHKPNGGVSSARNLGLDNASGEWITFVDADDYIEPRFLESFTGNLDTDLIIGGATILNISNGCKASELAKLPIGKVSNIKEFLEKFLNHPLLSGPWGKLFRTDIIKNNSIRFNTSLRLGEDQYFIWGFIKQLSEIYVLSNGKIDNCNYAYIEPESYTRKYEMSVKDAIHHVLTANEEYESLGIKSIDYENSLVHEFYIRCKNDISENGKLWFKNKEIRRICLRRAENIGKIQYLKTWLVFTLLYPIKIKSAKKHAYQ